MFFQPSSLLFLNASLSLRQPCQRKSLETLKDIQYVKSSIASSKKAYTVALKLALKLVFKIAQFWEITVASNEYEFDEWCGKTEVSQDVIDPALAARLRTTLLNDEQTLSTEFLPTLGHWCFFQSPAPAHLLSEDGHPQRGGFLPPIPLPRRMWAGGKLEFFAQIPIGATLIRHSTIDSIQAKEGRSGKLVFVTIRHEYWQEKTKLLTEHQDLVFREAATNANSDATGNKTLGLTSPIESTAPLYSQTLCGDAVTLFRFSALTFNSHRIHYDRDYAVNVEGYAGLVVHGPLLATQLAQFAEQNFETSDRRLGSFSFKAVSPIVDTQNYTLCAGNKNSDGRVPLWIIKDNGVLAMRAEAQFV
jgi:3-methylfumaryl-CoA hydratase